MPASLFTRRQAAGGPVRRQGAQLVVGCYISPDSVKAEQQTQAKCSWSLGATGGISSYCVYTFCSWQDLRLLLTARHCMGPSTSFCSLLWCGMTASIISNDCTWTSIAVPTFLGDCLTQQYSCVCASVLPLLAVHAHLQATSHSPSLTPSSWRSLPSLSSLLAPALVQTAAPSQSAPAPWSPACQSH